MSFPRRAFFWEVTHALTMLPGLAVRGSTSYRVFCVCSMAYHLTKAIVVASCSRKNQKTGSQLLRLDLTSQLLACAFNANGLFGVAVSMSCMVLSTRCDVRINRERRAHFVMNGLAIMASVGLSSPTAAGLFALMICCKAMSVALGSDALHSAMHLVAHHAFRSHLAAKQSSNNRQCYRSCN